MTASRSRPCRTGGRCRSRGYLGGLWIAAPALRRAGARRLRLGGRLALHHLGAIRSREAVGILGLSIPALIIEKSTPLPRRNQHRGHPRRVDLKLHVLEVLGTQAIPDGGAQARPAALGGVIPRGVLTQAGLGQVFEEIVGRRGI